MSNIKKNMRNTFFIPWLVDNRCPRHKDKTIKIKRIVPVFFDNII